MIYMLSTFLTRVLHLKFLQDPGKLTGDFSLFLFKSQLPAFKSLQAVQKVDTHFYLSILNLLMLQCSNKSTNLQEPYRRGVTCRSRPLQLHEGGKRGETARDAASLTPVPYSDSRLVGLPV